MIICSVRIPSSTSSATAPNSRYELPKEIIWGFTPFKVIEGEESELTASLWSVTATDIGKYDSLLSLSVAVTVVSYTLSLLLSAGCS